MRWAVRRSPISNAIRNLLFPHHEEGRSTAGELFNTSNIYQHLVATVFALGLLTEIIHRPFLVLYNRPPLIAFMKFNLDDTDRWTL